MEERSDIAADSQISHGSGAEALHDTTEVISASGHQRFGQQLPPPGQIEMIFTSRK